jgi:CDP-glycerol glycerophosphotransferase (TagB/SpsB family)
MWHLAKLFKSTKSIGFYCADPLDYSMFLPIKMHLDLPVTYIAKNAKTRRFLKEMKIPYKRYPAFPDVMIMARQTAYKFPQNNIVKIGFDHGLYQFKRWTSSKYYNLFDVYFVSSENQVEVARSRGINTTVAIGYPKLDQAFDGTYDKEALDRIKNDLGLDPKKKTIIFTSTWDVAGLSALSSWIDNVHTLTDKYNILVTAHTWTDKSHIEKLRNINGAVYLGEIDVTKYLLISDVFVGDYNSMIGEFCALDKPLITFKTPDSDRSIPAVKELLAGISIQIVNFDEIESAIERCLANPDELSEARGKANELMHYKLDGQAGKRAADIIKTKYHNLKN